MPIRRRRGTGLPAPLVEGFRSTAEHVQRAKDALVAAVPSPRGVVSVPLAESILRFEAEVDGAVRSMDRWRAGGLEATWEGCRAALQESLIRAGRLRLEAPELDYEGLVAALGDLLEPLDVFEEAERLMRPRS